jgi:uncharacterized protein YbgA (DUF1722 family)/uncharacterized protein YbbK (DUF523 family)
MTTHPRPKVVFSRCLGFDACRYNGQTITDSVVESLLPHVEATTVCPEVEIGLGVPRKPIRRIEEKGGAALLPALLQPETGRDVTSEMATFVERFLDDVGSVDGFVLKYRSPSCGISQVKIYNSRSPGAAFRKGAGVFGGHVLERFGGLAVEDEGRLQNFDIRQHFLTKLFAVARLREASESGRMADLVAYHSRHKFLLMAYNQRAMRELGRIVANSDRLPMTDVLPAYRETLHAALARAPRRVSAINVLHHGFGYVSDALSAQEKAFFLDSLERYRAREIPLSVPAHLVRSWALRFDVGYLLDQVFFEPFPQVLVSVSDSGKGREIR